MTRIRMNWRRLELTAEGHAGGGEAGHDVVCAGISAVTAALGQYLLRYRQFMRPELTIGDGITKIRARPMRPWRKRTRAAFRQAMDGLNGIAENYPDHVESKEEW